MMTARKGADYFPLVSVLGAQRGALKDTRYKDLGTKCSNRVRIAKKPRHKFGVI